MCLMCSMTPTFITALSKNTIGQWNSFGHFCSSTIFNVLQISIATTQHRLIPQQPFRIYNWWGSKRTPNSLQKLLRDVKSPRTKPLGPASPRTHRAGRLASHPKYYEALDCFGFKSINSTRGNTTGTENKRDCGQYKRWILVVDTDWYCVSWIVSERSQLLERDFYRWFTADFTS